MMKMTRKIKSKSFCIVCIVFTLLLSTSAIFNSSGSFSEVSGEHNDDSLATASSQLAIEPRNSLRLQNTRANNDDKYEIKTLTRFSSGSTKSTIRGNPAGDTVYLPIPSEANVTSASMRIRGRMPETLNKYDLGGRLNFITGADFNNDNNIDLISTDKENHTLRILINEGNSYFPTNHQYPTGDLPIRGITADLNDDGYTDVAIANEGANSFTVYQNTGTDDGKLENRKDYLIGDWPRDISSGDFNGDGWPDLATITSNDDKLWVNLNQKNSSTSFSKPQNFSTDESPVGMAAGDLNNDGFDDIAVINVGATILINDRRYYDSVSVFLNKGSTNTVEFRARMDYPVGKKPAGVIIDDFNSDGWFDIASSNRGGYNVSVLLNKGNGRFSNAINYSLIAMPYSGLNLHSGDIDGDGDSDIASICSKMNIIGVLRNNGDGTFQEFVNYPVPHRPADVFFGDFDNDGDLDVATCSQKQGSVAILSNKGYGTFSTFEFYHIGTYPRGITSGDIDSDGDIDLISANYLGGSLTICLNDGLGNFNERYDKEIAVEPFAVIVGDFDNDGHLDLASADEALYKIVLTFNDGDGKFTTRRVEYDIGGYPYSILYTDLNGDGKKDLITGNNAQLSLSILKNLGNGTFSTSVEYPFSFNHPFGLSVGDMDGDGDEDIIATNYGIDIKDIGSNISIVWNDGNGTFSSHTDYDVDTKPISVRTSDLDLDGDLDVIVSSMGSNTTTILFNHENTTLGSRRDYPVGPGPICISIADLNNDGYPDIVTANQLNDTISIMYNEGDGTFTPQVEYVMGAQPIYTTIADVNNDGQLDIATSNLLSNSISVRADIHYPEDISVLIGDSVTPRLKHNDQLTGMIDVPDFTETIKSYITDHQSESVSTSAGPVIMVPVKVTSEITGTIDLLDVDIKYSVAKDTDGDSIPDSKDFDDDNDNFPDDWEEIVDSDPKDPASQPKDTDNDMIPDGDTNNTGYWMDTDDDNDGMPDDWELENKLSTTEFGDAVLDLDKDGLTNLAEFLNETNPSKEDSDRDGLTDSEEVKIYSTNPLEPDTDRDGYSDYQEVDKGYNPLNPDDNPAKKSTDRPIDLTTYLMLLILVLIIILLIAALFRSRQQPEKPKSKSTPSASKTELKVSEEKPKKKKEKELDEPESKPEPESKKAPKKKVRKKPKKAKAVSAKPKKTKLKKPPKTLLEVEPSAPVETAPEPEPQVPTETALEPEPQVPTETGLEPPAPPTTAPEPVPPVSTETTIEPPAASETVFESESPAPMKIKPKKIKKPKLKES
jgi:cytoskeletal protein RodZ